MTDPHPDDAEPLLSPRTDLAVCAALLLLSALSLALAQLRLGPWNTPLELLIAAIQALVIAHFSMGLRSRPGMPRLVVGVALLWLAILLVGTLDDLLTRGWLPVPGK